MKHIKSYKLWENRIEDEDEYDNPFLKQYYKNREGKNSYEWEISLMNRGFDMDNFDASVSADLHYVMAIYREDWAKGKQMEPKVSPLSIGFMQRYGTKIHQGSKEECDRMASKINRKKEYNGKPVYRAESVWAEDMVP